MDVYQPLNAKVGFNGFYITGEVSSKNKGRHQRHKALNKTLTFILRCQSHIPNEGGFCLLYRLTTFRAGGRKKKKCVQR